MNAQITPAVSPVTVAQPAANAPDVTPHKRVKALTADGQTFEVPKELRDLLCFLDDGRLLVLQNQKLHMEVLAIRDRLKRAGRDFMLEEVSLTELRAAYALSPTADVTRGSDSDNQKRVLEYIHRAVEEGASDMHFVGDGDLMRIVIRVNGLLEPFALAPELPREVGAELVACIYQSMCDVSDPTFRPNKPQDARMSEKFVKSAGLYGARVATRPLDKGNLMVLRLLTSKEGRHLTMGKLGYLPRQQDILHALTQEKHGINIFSGATGSGKSTSLEVLLSSVADNFNDQLHILTLENPPEYKIRGARQSPVVDDDWEGGIKNAMRLDPDVMMVGEIRDLKSARAAFQAAMTGHGVWTTVHANDPFAALQRLDDLELDVGLYTDASLVTGLISQSLVPTLCPNCSLPWEPGAAGLDPLTLARLERHVNVALARFRNPVGCGAAGCRKGINGRSVVAEVVHTTQPLLDMFRGKGKAAARAHWINEMGGITKIAHVISLIDEGRVDPVLAERMVSLLDREKAITGAAA